MKLLSLTILLTVAVLIGTGPTTVQADSCQNHQRVQLPSCASATKRSNSKKWDVNNACPYPITVKIDVKSWQDQLWELSAYSSRVVSPGGWGTIRQVKCCPNYNPCSYQEWVDQGYPS